MSFTEDTQNHICDVRNIIELFQRELRNRAMSHDYSKLSDEEFPVFKEVLDNSKSAKYGTPEYDAVKKKLLPALEHHYKENRHHPEHFIDGIDGMNLVDVLEMLVDWTAATQRHKDDNIMNSIKINAKKYHINPQLENILINTVKDFFL